MLWGLQKSVKRSTKLYVAYIELMDAAKFPRIIVKCAGRNLVLYICRNQVNKI